MIYLVLAYIIFWVVALAYGYYLLKA